MSTKEAFLMANYIPIKNLVIANTKIVKTIFGVNISAEKFKKCKDAGNFREIILA